MKRISKKGWIRRQIKRVEDVIKNGLRWVDESRIEEFKKDLIILKNQLQKERGK